MRATAIRGAPVIDSHAARCAGAVAELVVDLVEGRLVALDIQHGDGLLCQRVPIERVETLEPRLVRVDDVRAVPFIEPRAWDERCLSTADLFRLPAMTEDGEPLGLIHDIELSPHDLTVIAYRVAPPLWQRLFSRAPSRLLPGEIVASSPDTMIVRRPAPRPAPLPIPRLPRLAASTSLLRRV